MIRDLPSNEGLLWKEIGPKARNQIRKATKSGLSFSKEGNRIQDFYDIYTEKMYQLGTPVHSKRFFEEILEGYKNYSRIVTIKFQARTVGVMLLIHYRDTASDPFAATLPEFNHLCPSMLMYWEAMCDAIQRGLGRFDMGRSQYGSGTYLFKKQWGAEPYEIDYSVIDRNGSHSIENNFYRSHAALFLSKIWCQMPRVVQRNLGPKVRRFMA
jgi:lipid II:glycine glycyltransferase (peptidoglycan interpeptide bridge formation enzyme)